MRRRSWNQPLPAATMLSLLILAACAGGAPSERSGGAQVEFQVPAATPSASTSPAPNAQISGVLNFTAPKLGGGQVVGNELAGQNVAVWFWAPW